MKHVTVLLLVVVFSVARPVSGAESADLDRLLGFEGSKAGAIPPGWRGAPPGTLFADGKVVHGGSWSGRIERTAASPRPSSSFTASIRMDFVGKTVELHGFLRTDGVVEKAGLWMREDDESKTLAVENMRDRAVRGTTVWTEYAVQLPVHETAQTLFFGAYLEGEGKVWVDDLRLLVDGKPIGDAPRIDRPKTALDLDHEFDAGSKVTIDALTPGQTANLATLGKVWGFLKYHHPKVTSGAVHWDYELFRVLPRVLAATDRAGAGKAILEWAGKLGDVAPCDPCASLPADLAIRPDVDWIHDRETLGEPLAAYLENVYRNRSAGAVQAYVTLAPFVGNPEFHRELRYEDPVLPDAGRRVLALFRWWNAVQYWSPYRDVVGSDWNAVLPEFLPRIVAATDVDRYRLEMLAVIARLNDGHANLWGSLDVRPPRGECQVPVRLRLIEGKPVVSGYTHEEKGPASGLNLGDTLVALGGVPIEELIAKWKPYYSASNEVDRLDGMMPTMTQGACGPVRVRVSRSGSVLDVATERRPNGELDLQNGRTHDLRGPAFRRLSPEVSYLKLSSVKVSEIPEYLRQAEGSKGLIVDIRNYPSEFVVFALGGHLVSEGVPFVRFTMGDPANPGAFRWMGPPLVLQPIAPHYPGRIVILVDEVSMSQAEYTAMALRAGPNAVVVGSTTAGADGNVSKILLPGEIQTMISGIGVFYPDKRPTQRVGIVPDVEALPTVAGIREGRDEVLEAAVRRIVGPDVPEARIRDIASP